MVVVDVVPVYRGYCANLCRTFVIGEPSGKQQEICDVYVRAKAAALAALKPGTKMMEVDAAAKSVFDEAGYGALYVAGISPGIGLGFEETPAPTIHPGHAGYPLRERMGLTVGHSVLSVPGVGGVRLEDTYFPFGRRAGLADCILRAVRPARRLSNRVGSTSALRRFALGFAPQTIGIQDGDLPVCHSD